MITIDFNLLTKDRTLVKNLEDIASLKYKKGAILNQWKEIIKNNQDLKKILNHNFENKLLADIYYKQIQEQYDLRKMYTGQYERYMQNEKRFELELFSVLVQLFELINFDNDVEVKFLLNYLDLLNSNDKFIPNNSIALDFHMPIYKIINSLLNNDKKSDSENKVLEDLFDLYFRYPIPYYGFGHVELYNDISKEISLLIPQFIKKYPKFVGNLVFHIFENYHPNVIAEYTNLLKFYLENYSTIGSIPILDEIFSVYNDRDSLLCKNSPKIIKALLEEYKFSNEQISIFTNELFKCFSIRTKEEYIQRMENYIESLKNSSYGSMVLKQKENEARQDIANAENIVKKDYQKALNYCIKSKSTKKSLELFLDKYKEEKEILALKSLFNDVIRKEQMPKKFPINKKANIEFKDLNLKLLIIQELMYNKECLKPKFILDEFVEEYTTREISIESDGYKIIPEVKKYFQNLDIAQELLEQIETLDIDNEYGGMEDILDNMWRFWDPGCGDEILYLSNKTIEDIKYLPNLKQISGINFTKIDEKNKNILKEKGILLIENEHF